MASHRQTSSASALFLMELERLTGGGPEYDRLKYLHEAAVDEQVGAAQEDKENDSDGPNQGSSLGLSEILCQVTEPIEPRSELKEQISDVQDNAQASDSDVEARIARQVSLSIETEQWHSTAGQLFQWLCFVLAQNAVVSATVEGSWAAHDCLLYYVGRFAVQNHWQAMALDEAHGLVKELQRQVEQGDLVQASLRIHELYMECGPTLRDELGDLENFGSSSPSDSEVEEDDDPSDE